MRADNAVVESRPAATALLVLISAFVIRTTINSSNSRRLDEVT